MSGFENNIINALNALIRAAIHSPNYVPGATGWSINKDGSAEFNNLTIRGTFFGVNFELNSNGLFFYSGTPALGNLVLSIAPVAGVDEFGNVYRAHIVAGLNTGAQTQIVATGGFGQLIFPLNNATFPGLALINTSVRTGPPAYAQLSLFGPSASAAGLTNLISEAWNSANASGTSFANKTSGYFDSSATYKEFAFMDASGFAIRVCSELTASDPANVVTARPQVKAHFCSKPAK